LWLEATIVQVAPAAEAGGHANPHPNKDTIRRKRAGNRGIMRMGKD